MSKINESQYRQLNLKIFAYTVGTVVLLIWAGVLTYGLWFPLFEKVYRNLTTPPAASYTNVQIENTLSNLGYTNIQVIDRNDLDTLDPTQLEVYDCQKGDLIYYSALAFNASGEKVSAAWCLHPVGEHKDRKLEARVVLEIPAQNTKTRSHHDGKFEEIELLKFNPPN